MVEVLPSFSCLVIQYRPVAYKPDEWLDANGCLVITKMPDLVRWDDATETCPRYEKKEASYVTRKLGPTTM